MYKYGYLAKKDKIRPALREEIRNIKPTVCTQFEISAPPQTYLRLCLVRAFTGFVASLLFGILCTLADSHGRLSRTRLPGGLSRCLATVVLSFHHLSWFIALAGATSHRGFLLLVTLCVLGRLDLLGDFFIFLVHYSWNDLCLC